MTNKAYIVVNEQQECEVLEKLEREGCEWLRSSKNPTDFIPSHDEYDIQFPYFLVLEYDQISWCNMELLSKFDIVFDGRKEEQMSDKYVVSHEFMNELEQWKDDIRHEWSDKKDDGKWLNSANIIDLERIAEDWWLDTEISYKESNNRLIAIIRWVNGEDVFEVEKPKKWVVRSKEHDEGGHYQYVIAGDFDMSFNEYHIEYATRFDTEEEAQEWANSHQEVVEVQE